MRPANSRLPNERRQRFRGGEHLAVAMHAPETQCDQRQVRERCQIAARAHRALRRYAIAGVRAWNRTTAASLRHALERDLEAIRSQDPRLSELYAKGIRVALEKF